MSTFFSLLSSRKRKLLPLIFLVIILLALPLTIILLRTKTNIFSHAAVSVNGTNAGAFQLATITPMPTVAQKKTYYVSKNGNNADGLSWPTAWNELNTINWSIINPGDTILIDGGATQQLYTTTLKVAKNGTSIDPITIKLAPDAGRNGKVVIFGGRSNQLPYCGQPGYTPQVTGIPTWAGIDLADSSWVTIDGTKWRGIDIHGQTPTANHSWEAFGINTNASSSNITLKNIEIYDNGISTNTGLDNPVPPGTVGPDDPGVKLKGANITFDQMIIHDNGQDAFQSDGLNGKVAVRDSWLYNSRQNPIQPQGIPFNHPCTHQDGMQIYSGGIQTAGITFDNIIFGPGLMQGVILNDTNAVIKNVTFNNDLFINPLSNGIMGSPPDTDSWTINNVTVFETPLNPLGSDTSAMYLDGTGFSVNNSVVYGGNIHMPTTTTGSGNCQFATQGVTSAIQGQTVDPKFNSNVGSYPNTVSLDQLINTDFSLQNTSVCVGKGSTITSVNNLLRITPIIGDINDDGKVDVADLSILADNFGLSGTSIINVKSDINGDGKVDVLDLSLLADHFGQ